MPQHSQQQSRSPSPVIYQSAYQQPLQPIIQQHTQPYSSMSVIVDGHPMQVVHSDPLSSQYSPFPADLSGTADDELHRVLGTQHEVTTSPYASSRLPEPLRPEVFETFDLHTPEVQSATNPATPSAESDGEREGERVSEPYAGLIYRALMSVPTHQMVLREIYEWFEGNTDKAKNGTSKGWQNSIRHNLSMNGSFHKSDQPSAGEDGKKGFIWVLSPKAIRDGGVESTTRYRKHAPNKKTGQAKSSQRDRHSSKRNARRSSRYDHRPKPQDAASPVQREEPILAKLEPIDLYAHHGAGVTDAEMYDAPHGPYYMSTPTSTIQSSIPDVSPYKYNFEDIAGLSSGLDDGPLFDDSYSLDRLETEHMLSDHFNLLDHPILKYEYDCMP